MRQICNAYSRKKVKAIPYNAYNINISIYGLLQTVIFISILLNITIHDYYARKLRKKRTTR